VSFHDVSFPDAIARGATGGPEYSTDVVTVASGFEQRNQNWSAARARYDIGTGIRTREQMAEVIAFFRARKGRNGQALSGQHVYALITVDSGASFRSSLSRSDMSEDIRAIAAASQSVRP
jgi:uncharacterized protein (TIGR02217 family)